MAHQGDNWARIPGVECSLVSASIYIPALSEDCGCRRGFFQGLAPEYQSVVITKTHIHPNWSSGETKLQCSDRYSTAGRLESGFVKMRHLYQPRSFLLLWTNQYGWYIHWSWSLGEIQRSLRHGGVKILMDDV